MVLLVDCCVRGENSSTLKFCNAFIAKQNYKDDVVRLNLESLNLKPLDSDTLNKRNCLLEKGDFSDSMFDLAKQFISADKIIIAAPFWDLSFPSLLKVYFEHISVTGLTFGYTESGVKGFCKADEMLYFSTCGGFTGGKHLGYEYASSLLKIYGIENSRLYNVEGLDIDPNKREEILNKAIENIR